jgi:hypothetical protein
MSLNLLSPVPIAVIGVIGFALVVFQMLLGYRKIKFPGRTHTKVHRRVAWAIVAVSLIHGGLGLYWVLGLFLG